MVITKEEKSDREIRLIASRDRLKESTQEIVGSFKGICENKEKFDQLVDDLLAKSKQYMLYSSQKEQIKRKYQLEKVYAKNGQFDSFIDFLFDNYRLLYTKLQSPIREIVEIVAYDDIEIEDLSLNSIEEEYMNSKGEHFREYLSKLDVKLDEVKLKFTDSFSDIFGFIVEEQTAKSGFALSKDQRKEYRDEMLSQLEPVLDKFNGKWMKISSDDLKNDDYKCYTEALKKMRSDEGIRKEIAQLYRKNNFLDIKDTKLSDRNGGRGFEIKGNRDKFSKFAEQLKDSSVGKDMSKCKKIDNETGESSEGGASLKLWASGFSHELKAIEFKGRDNDTTIEASLDIDMNKASEVEIPLDSTNMKELLDSLSLL